MSAWLRRHARFLGGKLVHPRPCEAWRGDRNCGSFRGLNARPGASARLLARAKVSQLSRGTAK